MNARAFVTSGSTSRPSLSQTSSYQSTASASMSSRSADGSNPLAAANPFGPPTCAVLIRKLPLNTTEDALRSMVVWSKDFRDAEVLPVEKSSDAGFRAAVLHFKSAHGALEAKNMLDGKPNIANDAQMIVELLNGVNGMSGRRYTVDVTANGVAPSSSTSSSTSSAGPTPRESSRFNASFQSSQRVSPTLNGGSFSSNKELPTPETSAHYQSLFSPQSPIGNHLNDRGRISGKSLINNDSVEDDETGELLKDPVAYAENGSALQGRRSTNSQPPASGARNAAGLSVNTGNGVMSSQMPAYPQAPDGMSQRLHMKGMMDGGPPGNYQLGGSHFQRHNFPPVNPADQNPPCNTLYVGNLPIDTSEDELKAMFSKQRGYKRLCFRTKQNGPMCFVEFEDISFATKALHELYGHPLHNSVKGGIRLSFSKNPLGVRSGQSMAAGNPANMAGIMQGINGLMLGPGSNFGTANGPPPGLAPPGMRMGVAGNMMPMHAMNGGAPYGGAGYPQPTNWTSHTFSTAAGAVPGMMNGGHAGFGPPAYMMGR